MRRSLINVGQIIGKKKSERLLWLHREKSVYFGIRHERNANSLPGAQSSPFFSQRLHLGFSDVIYSSVISFLGENRSEGLYPSNRINTFFFFCFLGRRKEGKVPCDFTSRFYVPFSVNTLSILLDGIFKYTMALIFYCFNNLSGFVFNNLSLKMKPNYFSKETYYQYKNKVSICLLIIKNLLWIWTVS